MTKVGALVGEVTSDTHIEDVTTTNSTSVIGIAGVGGVVGLIGEVTVTILNCSTAGTVSGEKFIGGLVGSVMSSTIDNSSSSANINAILSAE